MNNQWQFDFKDWQEAFEMFYRQKAKDSAFCLVISTHPYTSGYWVERDAHADRETKVYRSVDAVKGLEARVIAAREANTGRLGYSMSLGRVVD